MSIFQSNFDEIDRHSDPTSQRYGILLNWQDLPNPVWHYGIGLSERTLWVKPGSERFNSEMHPTEECISLETLTPGRGRAPVPTLLATFNRGNHGGIAPTPIG